MTIIDEIPDLPLAFARNGGSLLSAQLDGELDVSVSGALHSSVVTVASFAIQPGVEEETEEETEKKGEGQDEPPGATTSQKIADAPLPRYRRVRIPLDPRIYRIIDIDKHGTRQRVVQVPRRARVNATLTLGAVTSTGAACEANAGFGSVALAEALDDAQGGCALVALHYDEWRAPAGTVAVLNAQFWEVPESISTITLAAQNSNVTHIGAPRIARNTDLFVDARAKRLLDDALGSFPLAFQLVDSDAMADDATIAQAAEHFNLFVSEAATLRTPTLPSELQNYNPRAPRVYAPLPGLHKAFTSAPSGHAPVEAILHASSGLSASQLEGVLRAMATADLDSRGAGDAQKFLEETRRPGVRAARWCRTAARAVHLAIRAATDYHVDGAATLDPVGRVRFETAENWLPSTTRNFFKEAGDCDNSGTCAMRIGRQIGLAPYDHNRYDAAGRFISRDSTYDETKHVFTRAVRNALSHDYTLAFTIVGATTGEGSNAIVSGDGESDAVAREPATVAAGHAVPIFLPTSHVVAALARGDDADANELRAAGAFDDTARSKLAVDAAHREATQLLRWRVVMPKRKVLALALDDDGDHDHHNDEPLAASYVDFESFAASQLERNVIPLAIDGTVTSEMDLHYDAETLARTRRMAHDEASAADRLGTVMASRVVDLTSVGSKANPHGFYLHFVEATVPGGWGDDPMLREAREAAYQYIFAPLDPTSGAVTAGIAGATPDAVHRGDYALVPMQRLCPGKGRSWDVVRRETLVHAAAPRAPDRLPMSVEIEEQRNATHLRQSFEALHAALDRRGKSYGRAGPPRGGYVELHITPRMLWGNPNSLQRTIDKVMAHAVHGSVVVYPMDDVAPTAALVVVRFDVAVHDSRTSR
jgi:hypothetical protein